MDHAACSRSPGPRASGVFCPLCYLLELLVGVAHAGCCVPTRPRQVNEFENRTENDHLSITRARGSRQRRAPVQFRHGTLCSSHLDLVVLESMCFGTRNTPTRPKTYAMTRPHPSALSTLDLQPGNLDYAYARRVKRLRRVHARVRSMSRVKRQLAVSKSTWCGREAHPKGACGGGLSHRVKDVAEEAHKR